MQIQTLCVVLLSLTTTTYASDTIALTWDVLPKALAGRKVSVTTRAGRSITGTVAAGDAASLRLRTRKREESIPRGDIANVRIRKDRYKGRGIGLSIGALMSAGTVVSDGPAAGRIGAASVFLGIGYALGYWADSGTGTDVVIVQ